MDAGEFWRNYESGIKNRASGKTKDDGEGTTSDLAETGSDNSEVFAGRIAAQAPDCPGEAFGSTAGTVASSV